MNSSAPSDDLSASQFCVGVLVSPSTVVTARHCVAGRPLDAFDVLVGASNLCSTAPIEGERLKVARVSAETSADLAVVSLAAAARSDPLPLGASLTTADSLVAWGWGTQSEGGVPPCAAVGKGLTIVPLTECQLPADAPKSDQLQNYFCAVPRTGANTCHGDSGGPVALHTSDGRWLVGITASGRGCGPTDAGLYVGPDAIRQALGAAP